jgi:hypothetical protein
VEGTFEPLEKKRHQSIYLKKTAGNTLSYHKMNEEILEEMIAELADEKLSAYKSK